MMDFQINELKMMVTAPETANICRMKSACCRIQTSIVGLETTNSSARLCY